MTLEQICGNTAEQLEKLSSEELLKHFEVYLKVTRPEFATKPKQKQEQQKVYIPPNKMRALQMLEAEGVDMSFMKKIGRMK